MRTQCQRGMLYLLNKRVTMKEKQLQQGENNNSKLCDFISRDPLSLRCRCYNTALQETKRQRE